MTTAGRLVRLGFQDGGAALAGIERLGASGEALTARRAHARGLPTIAVGGGVTPEGSEALAPFGAVAVPVVERPQSVEDAMAAGAGPIERGAERVARLIGLTVSAGLSR